MLMLSPRLWRKRLVFWIGAILVGLTASGFAVVADRAQHLFAVITGVSVLLPLFISPAVFALVAWITLRYFPSTVGSGIPQAIAARVLRSPESQKYLLGPRVIAGKMLLTALALLGGASVGREGPTVQVGAAIMLLCAAIGGLSTQRGVVLAGAAAGVAAAFNTPLAGIVFAIEEMARSFEHRNSGIVLTAIVLSGVASMSVLGNYNYFGEANASFDVLRDWLPILAIGALGGVAGSLFARLLADGGKHLRRFRNGLGSRYPVRLAALCGLIVAVLGLATHGATYGTGYQVANDLLHGKMTVSWGYTIAKFMATVLSNVSGIPGGLFSPSLTVGAAFGSSMAPWFPDTPLQLIVLLGMVAYFAGVTQAPITAFVIVLEITGKEVTPAPLIAAAVIATAVARIISPHSLYHTLAKDFAAQARAILIPPEKTGSSGLVTADS
jgi:H+/Cl- antiporter ClcA